MTDNKIIKALEKCATQDCDNCSYCNAGLPCFWLYGKAIDLIKRQQAEIDNLEEKLSVEIADGGTSCHLCIKKHRAEVVKEFAEKLKAALIGWETDPTDEEIEYVIDRELKEMVGADNG